MNQRSVIFLTTAVTREKKRSFCYKLCDVSFKWLFKDIVLVPTYMLSLRDDEGCLVLYRCDQQLTLCHICVFECVVIITILTCHCNLHLSERYHNGWLLIDYRYLDTYYHFLLFYSYFGSATGSMVTGCQASGRWWD